VNPCSPIVAPRPPQPGTGKRAVAAAVAAALVAQPAHALLLGEPQVRSYLGRPLDVRIPVEGSGVDSADASCFSVLPQRTAGAPSIGRAQLSLEQQGGRSFLRVRSSESVNEPAAVLRVQAGCDGKGTLVREFGLLIDPMPAAAASAPLVVASSSEDVAVVQPAAIPAPAQATPVRTHAVARKSARHHASIAPPAHARAGSPAASPRQAVHRGGFMLKLSGAVLDLTPSRHIDEAQRAQLREARALLDADDYTSAMLALRDRIEALQRRMAQLQVEVASAQGAPAPSTPVRAAAAPGPGASVVATAPRAQPASRVPAAARQLIDASWWWVLVALLGLAALFLPVWRMARRRKLSAPVAEEPSFASREGVETGRFVAPPALQASGIAAVKAAAATSPELLADDTEEAIRNARDLYNAGDRLQAAGVLRLAIEAHPERVAPWLPLFDLLLRERLATEFAELARGFRSLHGASPAWKTVQRAGQQIDPGNALYREDAAAEHQAAA